MGERPHILLIGSTGAFGQRIAAGLAKHSQLDLTLAARDADALRTQAQALGGGAQLRPVAFDHRQQLAARLQNLRPGLVINASGPFQPEHYAVPAACIAAGCHYLDLADNRAYVAGFGRLDSAARQKGLWLVTGASTVPGLSAAVIDHFLPQFAALTEIDYAIMPGNRTPRGIGTVASILSGVGKPFRCWRDGAERILYGWQDLRRIRLPRLGARWLANCDIPDLVLFPARYPALHAIRFQAGLELGILHNGLWLLSWLARCGLIRHLKRRAALLRRISLWFYRYGSDRGGMVIRLRGQGLRGEDKAIDWQLIAGSGHGPQIPATAAILLAEKWLAGASFAPGARACCGLFTLEEFMTMLAGYDIEAG